MSVLVVGASHKSTPVATLERLVLDQEAAAKLLSDVSAVDHVVEATVISTCNRVEVYAEVDRFHGSVEEVSRLLSERAGIPLADVVDNFYVHYDQAAVSHLFQVAAGLDSMAVGESQILGQTRDALRLGQELSTVGPALNLLFQQALRVGKRAHAETDIDQATPSLVTAALALAIDTVEEKSVVIVGAGSMASLAAATIARLAPADLVVVNRSDEHAEHLAAMYGARWAPLSELAEQLTTADLVLTCTGSTGVIITPESGRRVRGVRPSRVRLVDGTLRSSTWRYRTMSILPLPMSPASRSSTWRRWRVELATARSARTSSPCGASSWTRWRPSWRLNVARV